MWKILIFFCIISSLSDAKYVHISGNITWNDFLTKAKYASREFIEKFEPFVLEHYPFEKVSEKCTKSLLRSVNGLKDWEPWAVRMADANGKLPSGFITGSKMDLGSYTECMNLRVVSNNESDAFKGQFCMMSLRSHLLTCPTKLTLDGRSYEDAYGPPPEWIKVEMDKIGCFSNAYGLYLGICTPSTCSQQEIYNVVEAITKPIELAVQLEDCHTDEPKEFPSSIKMIVRFLLCWLGILLVGTALDIYERNYSDTPIEMQSESVGRKVLKAFSLYTNTEKFLDTRQSDSPLAFLFGVKFFCCIWVIAGHVFFYPDYWRFKRCNNFNTFLDLKSVPTIVLECTTLCVDIFITISGFLMMYGSSEKKEKPKTENSYVKSILKTYFRLMTPVIFLILFTFVLPYMSNGPIWNTTTEHEAQKCYQNGWSNFLFLQNLFSSEDMCWLHTWYIASAVQIQLVAYLILLFVRRHFKTGIAFGVLITLTCYTIPLSIVYKNNYLFFSLYSFKSIEVCHEIVSAIYLKPFVHFHFFLCGMISGNIAKNYKGPISKELQIFGWMSFVIICPLVLHSIWYEYPDKYSSVVGNFIKYHLWALCWGWFLFACSTTKGILTKILSWKPLIVLGKLSFSVYIFHQLFLVAFYGSLTERVQVGKLPLVTDLCVLSVITFLFAYFSYIAIEIPCYTLFNIWEGKDLSTSNETSSTRKENNGTVIGGSDINKKEL